MVVSCWLKIPSRGNYSASRGSPSGAEQLPECRNFQFAPETHYWFFFLHTLPSTIAFRLEYVLVYQFYAKITIFRSRKFRYGSFLIRWRRNVWRKLTWNDVKTSKSSYWRNARQSSYTPNVRRHFLASVMFMEIPVGYARKNFTACLTFLLSALKHTWWVWAGRLLNLGMWFSFNTKGLLFYLFN